MRINLIVLAVSIFLLSNCQPKQVNTFWLDEMDISQMETGWSSNKVNMSIDGNPMKISGEEFDRGVGTHAISKFMLNMDRKGVNFKAYVGIDDETEHAAATVEFYVLGDKKILWESGKMTTKDSAKLVNVDISGIQKIALLVNNC